ncbi:MAG TPA: aldehyde ferredoxin oxidoreductase N-terminal domain-containing protein [Acidobacteriota bacterium]|nr:aldehyde ferredoxin oxidoreductase N-terminal domain-containing protein [Acidobacteriota bacterium]
MAGGYTGKILRINLTTKAISTMDTAKYEEFGGGHGIGSAIFFELVGDQLPFEAFDPRNVITIMTAPFSGTSVPGSPRCEVQGLAPMYYPIEWFNRSNWGGRFTAELKYAGWDGIVLEGASDEPVWVNIINDKVTIEKADGGLWGWDVVDSQQEIARRVIPSLRYGEWADLDNSSTTQIPAIACIGLAGENKSRIASIVHGAGSSAAQGGFGGVWGSKKLKAISVIGTGSVPIADPKALMDARLWFNKFQWKVDHPLDPKMETRAFMLFNGAPSGGNTHNISIPLEPARAAACAACPRACRMRLAGGKSNEATCAGTVSFMSMQGARIDKMRATDLLHAYGINHWHIAGPMAYIYELYKLGVLGPGKKIACDLPFDQYGKLEYAEALMRRIAMREGIGEALSEGLARAAIQWGRYEEDTASGLLPLAYWGSMEHYDPRVEVEWGYGSLLGERDIMMHSFNYPLHWMPMAMMGAGVEPYLTAEKAVQMVAATMIPYENDAFMMDYGEGPTGIYSEHKVKQVAWHRHYERFWIDSTGFCGWRWPMFFTNNTEDRVGATPEAEPKFWNAVTGKNITFADGMETGRKIWNMDKAIWVLQGRHRNQEVFPNYLYNKPSEAHVLPVFHNGEWTYAANAGRKLDRAKVEEWKTKFYDFEGWNTDNGWPKRKTLESLGMKKVADTLQRKNKLG